jgi:hypothetical protein
MDRPTGRISPSTNLRRPRKEISKEISAETDRASPPKTGAAHKANPAVNKAAGTPSHRPPAEPPARPTGERPDQRDGEQAAGDSPPQDGRWNARPGGDQVRAHADDRGAKHGEDRAKQEDQAEPEEGRRSP